MLVMATAIVKVLGAVFKIPLGNLIGELGMGYFQTAYDLYLPIYSIALAGMPIAVCRMVAAYMGKEQYVNARSVLKIAKIFFWVIGIVGTLVLFGAAYPYLRFISGNGINLGALPGIFVIAPCILFCCVMSIYRGYYEGLCNMTPTAVSQIVEALGKLVVGLGLAFLADYLGYGPNVQSAAAIFGIMLGTAFGALYLRLRMARFGDGITPEMLEKCQGPVDSKKQIFKSLIVFAIPVIIGAFANQIAGFIDVITVQRQLAKAVQSNPNFFQENFPQMCASLLEDPEINTTQDLLNAIPTYFYGCYKGFAFSVFSLAPTIVSAIGVSALPVVTTAYTSGNQKETKITMESVVRVTCLLCMPAGCGIAAVSEGILNLLYPTKPVGAALAASPLMVLGIGAIFNGLSMPLNNLLQAVGKERIPVVNMFIGAAIKIGLNLWLVGKPQVNIFGAAISTVACYLFIVVANFYFLMKCTKIKLNLYACFFKPLLAGGLCGLGAWAAYGLLLRVVSNTLATVGSIGIAAVIYLIAVFLLRIITKNDLLMVPKGEKIAKVLEKLGWIG